MVYRRPRRGGEEVNVGPTHHHRGDDGRPRTNNVPSGGVGRRRMGGGMTPPPAAVTSGTTRGWETDRRRCLGGGGARGGGANGDDRHDDRHRIREREDEHFRRRGVGLDDYDEESDQYRRDRRRFDIDTVRDDFSDHYSDDDDDDDDDENYDDDETDRRDDDDATGDEYRDGSNNSAAWSKFTPIPYHRPAAAKANMDDDGIVAPTSSSPNLTPPASIITVRSSSMSTTAAGVSSSYYHNYRHRRTKVAGNKLERHLSCNTSTGATTAKLSTCNTNASSRAATMKISNRATTAKIRNTNASSRATTKKIGNMLYEEEEGVGDMVEVWGGDERGAEGRRQKHHPSGLSTPKSHIAVDDRGMNNIENVRGSERRPPLFSFDYDGGMTGYDVRKSERPRPSLSTPKSHVAVDDRGMNNIDVARVRGRPPWSSFAFDYDVGTDGIDVGESERHPPPLSTPKSHVAVDDMGMNNIDIPVTERPPKHDSHQYRQVNNHQQQHHHHQQQHKEHKKKHPQQRTATSATFSAAAAASGSLKKFLRRGGGGASSGSGTNASTITSSYRYDEVDYCASAGHSIDLVVVVPSYPGGQRRPLAPPTHVVPTSDVVNDVDLLAYWSSLSVKAAMAVMSAGGGEAIARRAANAVLETSNNTRTRKGSGDVGGVGGVDRYLQDVATRVSLAILEEGGDHVVAAAASVAIMNEMGKKNAEKAKNDVIGCHATPFRNGNVGEKSVRVEPGSVSGMMDEYYRRVAETKKMGDKSKKEKNKRKVKNESQHLGCDEPSTRVDGDDQEEEKGGPARASKRLELQKMEDEIDRKRKELDERLARLGTTTSPQTEGGVSDGNRSVTTSMASRRRRLEAENAEILARNKALDEMTVRMIRSGGRDKMKERATESSNVVENENVGHEHHYHHHQQQQEQIEAKEEALKEKEAQIAFKSKELKEASRLNLDKEREIRERMSALDAVSHFHTSFSLSPVNHY